MRTTLVLLTAFVALHVSTGCSPRASREHLDASSLSDGSPPGTDGGGGASDAGRPAPAECRKSCSTAADCAVSGSTWLDEGNFACEAGACRHTGCNDDAECAAAFGGPAWVCRARECGKSCSTAADCAISGSTWLDEGNYACEAGLCRHTGCNDDAECAAAFGGPTWVCRARECREVCSTVADCATAGSTWLDEGNFACEAGLCRHTGCNDDAECSANFGGPTWTCH